jgi:TIR domain
MKVDFCDLTSEDSVFVSYSRKDVKRVKPFCHLLELNGVRVFRDEGFIEPGLKYREAIIAALKTARFIIVFWSSNSAKSIEVKAENGAIVKSGV